MDKVRMRLQKKITENYGLILFALTFSLILIGKPFPWVIESLYSNGIFIGLKKLYNLFIRWIPIPFIYIVILVLGIFTTKLIRKKNLKILNKLRKGMNGLLLIICIFYWFWGFNYFRIPFQEKVGYSGIEITKSGFVGELNFMLTELDSLERIYKKSKQENFIDLQDEMNLCIRQTLVSFDYKYLGESKIRQFFPRGNLLRISTAGIYLPFSFEGHIDGGLHPLQKPFTMLHEFFHGQGFTDEGICNFLAYVASCKTDNPWIRYSGAIGYWRYLQNQGLRTQEQDIINIVKSLPEKVRQDLIDISETMRKYPDIMPKLRDKVYDTYLKSNGVKAGLISYSQMVRYVIKWREDI
jgi:hypothetical protein